MSAPNLPRYHARSLSGWPNTETSRKRAPFWGKEKPPTLWQIQDSWLQWKVVVELGFHRQGERYAEERARKINLEFERTL